MVAVPHASQWRVRSSVMTHVVEVRQTDSTPAPDAGDVSLSAEDKPSNYLIYRPPAVQVLPVPPRDHNTTPNAADGDDDGDDNDDSLLQEHHHMEDHHSWLGGTTALKFLAAGGVAGAGQRSLCTYTSR
jgi:solute carrier family 25 phosphate transporter 23/24/25/41